MIQSFGNKVAWHFFSILVMYFETHGVCTVGLQDSIINI